MRKTVTALSVASLALIGLAGVGVGFAQNHLRVADTVLEFPTNDQESDVNIRGVAEAETEFPTNDQESDVNIRQVAELDVRYDYPHPRGDGENPDILTPGELRA